MLQQLLNHVERYLNDHCTVQDLEAWVLSNLQGILDSGDEAAIEVANQVDADLVELGEGLIDEATLREHLQSFISLRDTIPIVSPEMGPHATSHATAAVKTIRNRVEVPGPVVDVHQDLVFA
jgi:hypothetical protein